MSRNSISSFAILFLWLAPSVLLAQFTITGQVLDSLSKKPVQGVNIRLEGHTGGTSTDEVGRFRLEGSSNDHQILIVSHISYQETKVSTVAGMSGQQLLIFLKPKSVQLADVFITADRFNRNSSDVPAAVYSIAGNKAEVYSIQNTDELLYMIPGIRIDRDRGIFSKNSSISMRGLNGSARILVLLDGAPINKADGAGVNWNRIDPDAIERVEVMKGPNSTIYGGNAMGGVINIITGKNPGIFRARVKTFYGTYSTRGGSVSASGARFGKSGRGVYWSVNSFFRKGDGYIPVADSVRDSLNIATYLTEWSNTVKIGYQFSPGTFAELEYDYSWDKRGDGTRIYENEGSYNQYPTHFLRVKYETTLQKWLIRTNAFYQAEHYLRQNEAIKRQTGKYTLYKTDAERIDAGLWLTAAREFRKGKRLTAGFELKRGNVDASDLYYTSTDILTNKGQMDFGALFMQYESPLFLRGLGVEAGFRMDLARFHGGDFTIQDPTSLTEFMTLYPSAFRDTTWLAMSPRLALLYRPSPNLKFYLSYSRGFRPPTLDDMCRNGNITKGFKLANPGLGPEYLGNLEGGYALKLGNGLWLEQSIYYSAGRDFQYFVANGDSVYTGGSSLKPVLQRQNISKVDVLGLESSINFSLTPGLLLFTNLDLNHSRIRSSENSAGKSLEGKTLMEVPSHQVSAGLEYRYKWMMAGATFAFIGPVFADDDNLVQNPARTETGLKFSVNYREKVYVSLGVQDVFDHRYVDSKGNISPGRFILCSLIYKIFNK